MKNEIYKEILLEIAFSISGEYELEKVFQKSLPLFLSKLNCTVAAIFRWNNTDLKIEMIIPRAIDYNEYVQDKAQKIAHKIRQNFDADWFVEKFDGKFFYSFPLEEFGFLLLRRSKPFDQCFIKEFLQIIKMLTRASKAGLEVRKRKKYQQELTEKKDKLN